MKKNRFILIYLTLFTTFIYGNNDCLKYLPMPSMDGLVVVVPYVEKNVPDKDCDGIIDKWDADLHPDKPDTDHDGTIDEGDSDDDNDGWSDAQEAAAGTDPLDPNSYPNTPPVAVNDTATTTINTPVDIQVLANDSDINEDTLSISAVTVSENDGNVTIVDNIIRYTPPSDFSGEDSFVYSISDGHGGEANATVTVTIVLEPIEYLDAIDDYITVEQNTTKSISVLANDKGVELNITNFTQPSCGTVTQDGDNLVYSLDENCTGSYSFSYTIKDSPYGEKDTANVNVYIMGKEAFIFSLNTAEIGNELWVTGGEANNTHLLKDINKNSQNTNSNPRGFVKIHNITYFVANDGVHGEELWKSDGTEAGTVMVKDIKSGVYSSNLSNLTNVNSILYFSADDGEHGKELWKSDGTKAGTVMVKNIKAGEDGANPSELTDVNGTLYFKADDGKHGKELWKSDGTEAGTVMVKDIKPGEKSAYPGYLTNVNGTLYFIVGNNKLWKSDSTEAGTVMIKDMNDADFSEVTNLTNVNGTLFFTYYSAYYGEFAMFTEELWKSDGTKTGTILVSTINEGDHHVYPDNLTNVNGTLFFTFDSTMYYGRELQKSDGTQAGTTTLDYSYGLDNLTNVNGILYFTKDNGKELWKSNDAFTGTMRIYSGSKITIYGNLYGDIFFKDFDGDKNILLKSDGTQAGTVEIGRYY